MSDLRHGSAAYYEELGEEAEAKGDLIYAAAMFRKAAGVSIGQERKQRDLSKARELENKESARKETL